MTRARIVAAAGAAMLALVGSGCGSGESGGAGTEAQSVLSDLGSLRPGERLVKSSRAPRFSGPYTFGPGYTFRYRQAQAERITVALQSRRGSSDGTYQLLVDTSRRSGTVRLTVTGNLHVHVIRAAGPYVLRFSPTE